MLRNRRLSSKPVLRFLSPSFALQTQSFGMTGQFLLIIRHFSWPHFGPSIIPSGTLRLDLRSAQGPLRDLVGPTQNIGWRSRFDRKVHFYKASSLINWYVMKRWRLYIPIAQYVINLRKANSQLFQLRC